MQPDLERRFGGVSRLYGTEGLARLQAAHVTVVGIGGVGSWAAEALARSGIGALTLIDLDMVAESNTNRQIQALDNHYGRAKVDVMAERIHTINPGCQVKTVEDFVTPENVADLLHGDHDFVLDATDQVKTKAAMIAHCRRLQLSIITAGAAGGQFDPTRIAIADLARTEQDPLLSKVRALLRREYGFTRKPSEKFGIPAVYSSEPLRYPERSPACEADARPTGLNCAGFGSSVCVTACFGMAAAAHVLREISLP